MMQGGSETFFAAEALRAFGESKNEHLLNKHVSRRTCFPGATVETGGRHAASAQPTAQVFRTTHPTRLVSKPEKWSSPFPT